MAETFVVVGAGMCAAAAVEALRQGAFEGRIVLVGEETDPPYERPPLSKQYLRGETDRSSLLSRPEAWYRDHDVDLQLGARVSALREGPSVELQDGEAIGAAAVLLATGGRPRLMPGAEPSERVLYLRRVEDADRIRAAMGGERLIVCGAGFIGAEVAASARMLGRDVTVLERSDVPLKRALGDEIGALYGQIHRDEGVDLRTGTGVEAIEEGGGGVAVRTTDGDTIEGSAVVVGIGIEPNVELAERAGLEVGDGIVVDERCRTSAGGVFAAGDVANHRHPRFGPIRVEHFDNAIKMGAAAARSMMGDDRPYDDPHWFWSDQYDVNLQYAGFAASWDRIVTRGSLERRDGVAFFLRDGTLLAALGLNRGRDVRRAMKLIGAGVRPDPTALADEEVDLRILAPSG